MTTGRRNTPGASSPLLRPLVCTVLGLIGNILLTAGKLIVGSIAGSASLIADGFHSFSDLAGDVGLLIALRASRRPPDKTHPYGHHNYETLGAIAASLLLVGTGVLIARDAIYRIYDGETHVPEAFALAAAIVSIVLKELMARYTYAAARVHNSPALRTNAAHHRSDALSSIAAVAGILGALAGLPILDSVAALIIAAWIVYMGWELLKDNAQILMEASPDKLLIGTVRETALEIDEVHSVSSLRLRPRGSVYMADIAVTVPPRMSVEDGHAVAHQVEDRLVSKVDGVVEAIVHVEPDTSGRLESGRDPGAS